MDVRTFQVGEQAAAQRLDRWLAGRLPELSRTQLQTLIQKKRVCVNERVVAKPSFLLTPGDQVSIDLPPPKQERVEPQNIPLDILYEDEHFIAVHKPVGMVIYPAPGHERHTLVNALLHHTTLASVGAPIRPGIVHRLDKETSGVMVVAKTDEAYYKLIEQFKERTLQKTYLAWVCDNLQEGQGRIEAPIGRDPANRKRMAVIGSGKHAVTEFVVRKRLKDRTLVEIDLITGRTHQVRVHFAYIKHPVFGDPEYGRKTPSARMMLHAWKLELLHPVSGNELQLEAPVPQAFDLSEGYP